MHITSWILFLVYLRIIVVVPVCRTRVCQQGPQLDSMKIEIRIDFYSKLYLNTVLRPVLQVSILFLNKHYSTVGFNEN